MTKRPQHVEVRISFILAEVQTALEATRKASSHENTNWYNLHTCKFMGEGCYPYSSVVPWCGRVGTHRANAATQGVGRRHLTPHTNQLRWRGQIAVDAASRRYSGGIALRARQSENPFLHIFGRLGLILGVRFVLPSRSVQLVCILQRAPLVRIISI
jgi:hypothetical protein